MALLGTRRKHQRSAGQVVVTTPREQAEKSGGRWAKVLFVGGPRHGMVQLMSLDQSYVDVPCLPIDWEGSELRCDTYFRREMTTGFRNLV